MKVFPAYEKYKSNYQTRLRLNGDSGYYFVVIKSNSLELFIKQIYFAIILHKYTPDLIDLDGNAVCKIDKNQQSEVVRLTNFYFPELLS